MSWDMESNEFMNIMTEDSKTPNHPSHKNSSLMPPIWEDRVLASRQLRR